MNGKKILFDLRKCQPIGHIKFHGGGVYGHIVFEHLCRTAPESLVAYWDTSKFIDPLIKQLIDQNNITTIDAHRILLKDAVNEHVALFYSPLFDPDYATSIPSELPICVTIHGLRKLEMNRDSYEIKYAIGLKEKVKCILKQTLLFGKVRKKFYDEYIPLLRRKNMNVVTVSNHSKQSLLFYYPFLKESQINVFYSPSTTTMNVDEIMPSPLGQYYLIISADRWLKNSRRAIEAFDILFEKGRLNDENVVVVGLSDRLKLNVLKHVTHKERFILKEYVDKCELEALFKGAKALIYPSLNEGFGYPPLEAMKYGTPVIASPFSSIPEVCADSVLYANPYSVEEIAMRIQGMNSELTRNKYVELAKKRYAYITKKQTDDLEKMIQSLLEKVK